MSTARFKIYEHTLPTSHIREYPRGTADDQEVALNLAIKQYTPLDANFEDEGDVTIIGAHANGFPKVQSLRSLTSWAWAYSSRNCMNLCGTICMSD